MKYKLVGILILFTQYLFSQNLGAYHNFRDQFYVFDNGNSVFLEHLPVTSFEVGNKAVVYFDNSGFLKIYRNGEMEDYDRGNSEVHVTDNLIFIEKYGILKVDDDGVQTTICSDFDKIVYGDSIIAVFDNARKKLLAYYNREIIVLEDALGYAKIRNFKAGDNIVAFVDNFDFLKVFYQGEITEIMLTEKPVYYKTARNLVAYINPSDGTFNVFYKREFYELSMFRPQSYFVNKDRVIFIDNGGVFYLFDRGELYEIESFEPDFYKHTEQMIIYSFNGLFKVYYQNQSYELENYIPDKYIADQDIIVYLDQENHLKVFDKGETKIISYDRINSFEIYNQVVLYNIGVNTSKVYFQGRIY